MSAKKNICPWCGIVNAENAVQCAGCGSELHPEQPSSSEAAEQGRVPSVGASEETREPAGTPRAAEAPRQAASKKAKRGAAPKAAENSWFRPGVMYAGIAAVVVLGYLYLTNEKKETAPGLEQNTSLIQPDSSAQRIRSMEQFLEANPKDTEAMLAYANMLHDARQFGKAIPAYRKFLASDPKNADARVDMAICLFESGDGATAIAELKKALDYAPKHQAAMFNLGVVYLNQGNMQASNDWFSRCAAVDPGTPIAARAQQLVSQHSSTNKNLK